MNGEIKISLLSLPDEVRDLLEKNDEKPKFCRDNIKAFNFALVMASLGAKQQHFPRGVPPVFKIQCTVSHRIGSLLQNDENADDPKFVQIYIYDTEHETENRLKRLD